MAAVSGTGFHMLFRRCCPHTEPTVADAKRVADQADWDPSQLTGEEVEIIREATANPEAVGLK